MEEILDILKYILPSLVVFGASYYVMKLFIENESRQRLLSIKLENNKLITPVRLQAYERIILFLERITPSNMIMRLYNKNMSSIELQSLLVRNVREEYEHNLSQQIFLSDQSWEMVKKAKEEIIKLINTAAAGINDKAPSQELSHAIINKALEFSELPNHKAIAVLKKEIRQVI